MRAKKRETSHQFFLSDCTRDFFSKEQLREDLEKGRWVAPLKHAQKWIREVQNSSQNCLLFVVVAFASLWFLSGCVALVSGTTTSPSTALDITNVQAASTTTSTAQINWTTNVPATSSVDYGTTSSYGTSTPVDSAMVTNHQVIISGLSAGTTYYYQVQSTDSKNNHGKSGGHNFATAGFSISGAISPIAGGSGATVTVSGTATAKATANSSGNYALTGLPNGTYAVTPSHTGYTFSPTSQTATINGANDTGINFTATAQAGTYSISGTITPTAGGSGASVTLSGAAAAVTTADASGNYSFGLLTNGAYTVTPSNVGYTFSPVNQSVTVNSANVSGVNFTATVQQTHSVALSWNASTSVVAGYNVYRSTVSGAGYTRINSSLVGVLAYTDATVQNSTTYYYVTTAVDSSGNESVYSNQAAAVIP